jgi:hypothetical protein
MIKKSPYAGFSVVAGGQQCPPPQQQQQQQQPQQQQQQQQAVKGRQANFENQDQDVEAGL